MTSFNYIAGYGSPAELEAAIKRSHLLVNTVENETSGLNQAVRNVKIENVVFLLSKGADLYLKLGSNGQNILSNVVRAIENSLHPEGKEWAKKENLADAIRIFELLLKHEKENYPEEILMLDRKSNFDVTPMDHVRLLKKTDPETAKQLEDIIEKYHPGYVAKYYKAREPKPKKAVAVKKPSSPNKKESRENPHGKRKSPDSVSSPGQNTQSWIGYFGSFFGVGPASHGYEVIGADPSSSKKGGQQSSPPRTPQHKTKRD